jgi:predicted NBD/HSP70 family sugar kinase
MSFHVIGVDLGGTNVRVRLADGAGARVHELTEPTHRDSAGGVLAQIADLCREVAARAAVPWTGVVAAGLGAPGVIAPGGALRLAPNLPSFGQLDLARDLGARLGIPVAVDNDVNMATAGEHRRGAARGCTDFAFVAIGTGIGMGFVAGDRVQRGATGAAGEIAALPFGADPGPHPTPLEATASGAGLAARYGARTGRGLAAEDVFARAAAGDADARAVLDDQAVALAHAVMTIQAVLDPALVVLGGGIGSREDVVLRVRNRVGSLTTARATVVRSALGASAGLAGAVEAALTLRPSATVGDATMKER